MIVKLYMKTPDAVSYALNDAVERALEADGLRSMDDAWQDAYETIYKEEYKKLEQWFKYGEHIWFEIDTNTGAVQLEKQR